MVEIQAMQQAVQWAVYGITIILMVIAGSMAIKKKNNLIVMVDVLGNLAVFYFTQSPLLCWAVSIACMIWAGKSKPEVKQNLKASKARR